MDIVQKTKQLYKQYGQSKEMIDTKEPCYFLQRNFKGEQDLLIIFKTPPCGSKCKFCNLSDRQYVNSLKMTNQFIYVVDQLKHSLSVLDRVTLSNNGSIFNPSSVDFMELIEIIKAISQIKNISTVVFETDFKYINEELIKNIKQISKSLRINVLTGFETLDMTILNTTLGKYRDIYDFEKKLDLLARNHCDVTAYILYKPLQSMTDEEAYYEAEKSAMYLIEQCDKRNVHLTLRINPMFAAKGTEWAAIAERTLCYSPPKIAEVFCLAKKLDKVVPTYVGLSTESKSENWGSYRSHDSFTHELMLDIIHFNTKKG